MKRFIVFLLLIALLLAGCGKADESKDTQPSLDSIDISLEDTQPVQETPETEPTEPQPQTHEPVQIQAPTLPTGYQLTEIGTISDPKGDLGFRSDGVLVRREYNDAAKDNFDTMLDPMGQPISDQPAYSINHIYEDIYAVTPYSDTINATGLVTASGEVLIPYEAAIIDVMYVDRDYDPTVKYLRVTYSTGETTNQDEAFFYVTDRFFAMAPEEGDVFHTGYARIYDLENRKFLNFNITNPDQFAVQSCGEYLMMEEGDRVNIYDDTETVTASFPADGSIECGWNYLVAYENGAEVLYHCDGTMYYRSEDSLAPLSPNFITETIYADDGRHYTIRDIYGNEFLQLGDVSIYDEHYGTFQINQDDTYTLTDYTGAEKLSTSRMLSYVDHGCWYYSESTDSSYTYYLVLPDGTKLEGEDAEDMAIYRENDNSFDFYVFGDGDYTLSVKGSNIRVLDKGLVSVRTDKGYGLYDLFSGTELLSPTYRSISSCYGNIYAYSGDSWTVFDCELIK